MAFNITYFAPAGQQAKRGRAPQLFHYRTADTAATIMGNNYFSEVSTMLEAGDLIVCQYVDDEANPVDWAGTQTYKVAVKVDGLIVVAREGDGFASIVTKIDDVSTAATAAVTAKVAGTIVGIKTILGGVITTANSAMTFNIGGTPITNSAITVTAAGSAFGDIDTSTPSAANTLAVGNVLNAITDGASTGVAPLYVIYELTV